MRRLKTLRRPPIYPKTPGHLPCSSLTHPLPLPSRRPSVSFGGFGLRNVTLVIHDWGSALGFHYAMRNESNVKGIAFMEALLMPIPSLDPFPQEMRGVFTAFRTPEVGWDMIVNQNMFIEQLVPGMVVRKLTDAEMDAIREPFTDPSTHLPLWRWPNEIPHRRRAGRCPRDRERLRYQASGIRSAQAAVPRRPWRYHPAAQGGDDQAKLQESKDGGHRSGHPLSPGGQPAPDR